MPGLTIEIFSDLKKPKDRISLREDSETVMILEFLYTRGMSLPSKNIAILSMGK